MSSRYQNPRPQYLDISGDPLLSSQLNFYETGTLTRKDTFADVDLTIVNANPVLLAADGSVPNIFYGGSARVILTYDSGAGRVQRFDVENVGTVGTGTTFDIWNAGVEYEIAAIVQGSNALYYRSLSNGNKNHDPITSDSFWEQIDFLRVWNPTITYNDNQLIVGSNGKLYSSLQNGNLNKDPLTETTWWELNNPFDQVLNTTSNVTFNNIDGDAIEFDSLSGTGAVTITDILDEDNMASDSATMLATQQSIKSYVDAQVGTVDTLSEVLAIGNTTGGTDVSVSTDDKVQFRDAAIYINSSADGQLDIVADTEIQIAATTIDINGAVALNGALTGITNITLSGELDAATGDFSGDVDVDGTLEADAITLNGTALGSLYSPIAGSSSIVTTGALNSGSITSGFGTINNGASAITTTGALGAGAATFGGNVTHGSAAYVTQTDYGTSENSRIITGGTNTATGYLAVAQWNGSAYVNTVSFSGSDSATTFAGDVNIASGGTLDVADGITTMSDGTGNIPLVLSSTDTGVAISFQDDTTTSTGSQIGAIGDVMFIKTTGVEAVNFDASQNATFAGDVSTTAGSLTIADAGSTLASFTRTSRGAFEIKQGTSLNGWTTGTLLEVNTEGLVIQAATQINLSSDGGTTRTLYLDNSSNATFAGDMAFSGGNVDVDGGDPDGRIIISSNTNSLGGNLLMYGNTHASLARNVVLRSDTTAMLTLDGTTQAATFAGDVSIEGGNLFKDATVGTGRQWTGMGGATGAQSEIDLDFDVSGGNASYIVELQISGYSGYYVNYLAMVYTDTINVIESNLKASLAVTITRSTNAINVNVAGGSVTHPCVSAKVSVGGLRSLSGTPTISFTA